MTVFPASLTPLAMLFPALEAPYFTELTPSFANLAALSDTVSDFAASEEPDEEEESVEAPSSLPESEFSDSPAVSSLPLFSFFYDSSFYSSSSFSYFLGAESLLDCESPSSVFESLMVGEVVVVFTFAVSVVVTVFLTIQFFPFQVEPPGHFKHFPL